jgi:hypothetical protein
MLVAKTQRKRCSTRNTRKSIHSNYLCHLQNLYPEIVKDTLEDKEVFKQKYKEHKTTYGEMEYEGLEKLFRYIKKFEPRINTFIDVGSGRGKLVLYMAAKPIIKKTIGIELVDKRHENAIELKNKLDIFKNYTNKVTLLNENVLEISFKDYLPTEGLVFVWFSNLCFDQEITDSIFSKMREELPKGSIICCSQCPNTKDLDNIPSIKIPMTWSVSTVSIYRL